MRKRAPCHVSARAPPLPWRTPAAASGAARYVTAAQDPGGSPVRPPVLSSAPSTHSWYIEFMMFSCGVHVGVRVCNVCMCV